jgi:hypothetical protein
MPHCEIDLLVGEIDVMCSRGNTEVKLGMQRGEAAKAMDQPFGSQVW